MSLKIRKYHKICCLPVIERRISVKAIIKRKRDEDQCIYIFDKRNDSKNPLTCPKCGLTDHVTRINTSLEYRMFKVKFYRRQISEYMGCSGCYYDFGVCEINKNYVTILKEKLGNDYDDCFLYDSSSDLFDFNSSDDHVQKKKQPKNINDIQCNDILACQNCLTVVDGEFCVGCGKGSY